MTERVNHPPHYQSETGLEAIDVIEAFGLGFCLGNAVKYILRADRKGDRKTDLRKALWYLQREVDKMDDSGHSPEDVCADESIPFPPAVSE